MLLSSKVLATGSKSGIVRTRVLLMYSNYQEPLQIPYGLLNGRLVTPIEEPRGLSVVKCLECDEPLVAEKGDWVRPYFRHQSDSDRVCDYSGESVRHRLAKAALAERIQHALANGVELPIRWSCDCPQRAHKGNLVRVATSISLDDRRVGPYLPDIGIFDDERCRAFVEIEHTHANTLEKVAYCEDNDIGLATIVIRNVLDPVAHVRQTPLPLESSNICPYRLGEVCHCGGKKPSQTDECIRCLRLQRGIDIDIAGSYRIILPRFGAWTAIVTDADGSESLYTDQDLGDQDTLLKMLRSALLELEQDWQGAYRVRIHSTADLKNSLEGKRIFADRSELIRYWRSLKNNRGSGVVQSDRIGRLVSDRPSLSRAAKIAKDRFQTMSRASSVEFE